MPNANRRFSVGEMVAWFFETPGYHADHPDHPCRRYGEGPFKVLSVKPHPLGQMVRIETSGGASDELNASWFIPAA